MSHDQPRSPASSNFAAEVRRLGLTQAEAAERLGVHIRQVDRWVHGRNEPSYRALAAWGKAFGRAPAWFLEDHEDAGPRRRGEDLQPDGTAGPLGRTTTHEEQPS